MLWPLPNQIIRQTLIKYKPCHSQVINFYMNLVMSRSEQEVGGRKVYSFSTFLFPKLHSGGHAAVRRWTKAVDLFLYDVILVPLHLGVHWSLAVSNILHVSWIQTLETLRTLTSLLWHTEKDEQLLFGAWWIAIGLFIGFH